MKHRIIAAVLAVLTLIAPLAGCTKNEVPSGMQKAYRADAPYKLYVPTGWKVDTSSLSVSAYSTASDPLSVTVTLSSLGEGQTLDGYWQSYTDRFASVYKDFKVESSETAVVDGAAAMKYTFRGTLLAEDETAATATAEATATGESAGNHYKFVQYLTANGGVLYIITFSAIEANYANHTETIAEIMANFKFNTAPEPAPEGWVNGEAPELDGMKNISNKIVDYEFYVPEAWTADMNSGALSAFTDGGKASVTVAAWDVPHMDGMLDRWKDSYISDIGMIAGNFTVISDESTTLDGKTAVKLTSSATVAGAEYKYTSVAVIHNYMVYVITYTATADTYDAHLGELDAILSAFSFR